MFLQNRNRLSTSSQNLGLKGLDSELLLWCLGVVKKLTI